MRTIYAVEFRDTSRLGISVCFVGSALRNVRGNLCGRRAVQRSHWNRPTQRRASLKRRLPKCVFRLMHSSYVRRVKKCLLHFSITFIQFKVSYMLCCCANVAALRAFPGSSACACGPTQPPRPRRARPPLPHAPRQLARTCRAHSLRTLPCAILLR